MNQKYMDAVVATGTLGLGVGVAVTQLGLFVGTAATNLVLDCIIITKNTGKEAMNKGVSIEKAIEERIYNAIGAGQELAKNPTEKLTEHANTFLDIANSVTDNIFGFPKAVEDPESSLKERVTFLAGRIAGGLKVRTNEFVIDPLTQQINAVVEQFGKCLVLVDYLKQRQEWTYTKVGQLSTSMSELRNTIEVGAKNPSECLLGLIRLYSSRLNEQLVKLRERGAELLSASMQKQVQAATMYVQHLDETLANAQSIDEVKQEVFVEAKQKVTEIAQWSNSILLSANKQPKEEQNATMDN